MNSRVNHFGKNPVKGGSPLKDKININIINRRIKSIFNFFIFLIE